MQNKHAARYLFLSKTMENSNSQQDSYSWSLCRRPKIVLYTQISFKSV
jgi:hypothetical protein